MSRGSGEKGRVAVLFGLGYDPEVRLRRTTQSLAAAGWEVEIVAWDRALAHPAVDSDGPVRIRRVHVRSRRGRGVAQLLYLLPAGLAMIRHLRRSRPDVVHAVDLPMLLVAVLGRPLLGRPSPRLVYDAFEIYNVMVAHSFPRPVRAAIALLERLLPRRAELVITPGEARSRYLRQRGIQSIVVPNWIDPPARRTSRAAARAELGVPESSFCLAYVGGVIASRDIESLLEHARLHPGDTILIAGFGDRVDWLQEVIKPLPNVRFLGWLADPSLPLAAADALYYALKEDHPYAALAAPNNLYVAIAHGLPLVYRPQGELAIVGDVHEIGVMIHDAASLSDGVDRLRDARTRARIKRVMGKLRKQYTWSAAVAPLLEVYPRRAGR